MSRDKIVVKGARQHNLQNIDIEIPRDKLVVLTGLSGSGKSSLAFDTIYAEGQRRYVESLSSYARQFLGQMDKPDVDSIEGLSPAISIDQKTTSRNPRSTVGTVTEVYDYLRLLFARIGKPYCPECGKEIAQQTVQQIVDQLLALSEGTKLQILAPLVRGKKGEQQKLIDSLKKSGYVRLRIDGNLYEINEIPALEKNKKHNIEVVIDRIIIKSGTESRLADSLETALKLAEGVVILDIIGGEELVFSQNFACADCGISFPELEPRMFSFNSPFGACRECDGLGETKEIDPELIVPDDSLSLSAGAVQPWSSTTANFYPQLLAALAKSNNVSLDTPFRELPEEVKRKILFGTDNEKFSFRYKSFRGQTRVYNRGFEGVIPNLARRYRETASDYMRAEIEKYMINKPCPVCQGKRLSREALSVRVGEKNIHEVSSFSIEDCYTFFENIELGERDLMIGERILKEIKERLLFLVNVGLDYLTLSRAAGTLSGGEAQRIRLATQIGSGLVGVLYILDEPSIGLHQKDNSRLLETLLRLRDLGNTLLVVEHDEETMLAADYLIDIGPGAGIHGGKVVAAGSVAEVKKSRESITGQFLSGKRKILLPAGRRMPNGKYLEIIGAAENNLQKVDLKLPLGIFTCITGVSGSGKSTLINEILYKAVSAFLYRQSKQKPGKHERIKGLENLDKVIEIDQSPIGRTPRSNPATYTSLFDGVREVFSQLPDSRMRGYKPGRFSFNVKGGRCEACKGDGIIKIEMHFLPDIYVPCEVCGGKRYNRETLEVKYKGKNISEVLEMTVDEATEFFANLPKLYRKLKTLQDVGLGYIHLGQPATTLSGGEAQRIKLASELSRRSNGRTLYILDEPTTGLHLADIEKLLVVLNRLVENGDTVVVIEHNLEVIKTADYIVDLGPEGGNKGGRIIACGTPEEVAAVKHSYTGNYLKKILKVDAEHGN